MMLEAFCLCSVQRNNLSDRENEVANIAFKLTVLL